MKTAIFVLVMAGPAVAQPFTCEETSALDRSAAPFVDVVFEMVKRCQGRAPKDETCLALVDALSDHQIRKHFLEYSARSAALAVRCPVKR